MKDQIIIIYFRTMVLHCCSLYYFFIILYTRSRVLSAASSLFWLHMQINVLKIRNFKAGLAGAA